MARNRSWREIFIKILEERPDESEYQYAAELIEGGYAKGSVLPSTLRGGPRYLHLVWKGPTLEGREYCDDLKEAVRRRSLSFRIWSAVVVISSWLAGVLTDVIISRLTGP